jgi:hypothetical protein
LDFTKKRHNTLSPKNNQKIQEKTLKKITHDKDFRKLGTMQEEAKYSETKLKIAYEDDRKYTFAANQQQDLPRTTNYHQEQLMGDVAKYNRLDNQQIIFEQNEEY